MSNVSIIIPSRNRPEKLKTILSQLVNQEIDATGKLQIIAALDGDSLSWDPDSLSENSNTTVNILELEHVGISEAKNKAAEIATGDILLFLNDDISVQPGFVRAHVQAIEQNDYSHAVLGHTEWETYDNPTLMDELIKSSPMIFFYEGMIPNEKYGFRYAWNLNLSIPKPVFEETGGFANSLRPCMYEDIELAHRIDKKGHNIVYHPEAMATHNHRYTWESYLKREIMLGVMAPALWQANRDCFCEIFKKTLDELVEEAKQALPIDRKDDRRQYDFLNEELSTPAPAQDEYSYFKSLYLAHLPIKRRAFRFGLLKSTLKRDTPWQQRSSMAADADIPNCLFEE